MKNITVPELGESIIEGTITSWLVKEGENFKSGDNLAEIETEKITIEIPAQSSGKLTKIIAPVGATVNVGQSIAEITDEVIIDESPESKINQIKEKKETAKEVKLPNKPDIIEKTENSPSLKIIFKILILKQKIKMKKPFQCPSLDKLLLED